MLHTLMRGAGKPDLVFCHGLFGQAKNWASIAANFMPEHCSLLIDMPNHGRSDWTETFDYLEIADLVATTIKEKCGPQVNLVGHSMGGKIAMIIALRHPQLVARLVVADISPVQAQHIRQFSPLVEAMESLELTGIKNRSDADKALRKAIDDDVLRGFLLQNLYLTEGHWKWRMNLNLLGDSLREIGAWPIDGARYLGPTLWIKGGNSKYIHPDHHQVMRSLFPQLGFVEIPNAGHWVHADQPALFTQVVRAFIDDDLIIQPTEN